jgi:carboxypeptidase family protein
MGFLRKAVAGGNRLEVPGINALVPNYSACGDMITAMTRTKSTLALVAMLLLTSSVLAQDRSSGSIKGKVRVETGTPAGVTVIVKQGEHEVARGLTDKKGEFVISRLAPGIYAVTFRKPGLSVGTIENLEVKAGKSRSLGQDLVLGIDEGSIAFLRGSVFNEDGRSVPNVKIELARIQDDGSLKKIDGRVSNEIGSFVFRLTPEVAKYRLTAKPNGGEPVTKDVEVDGPAIYRIALAVKTSRN